MIKILNADALFSDAVSSSAIEGVNVSYDSVYFFLAKALNLDFKGVVYKVDKNSASLASLVLDAFTKSNSLVDEKRMLYWHELLFGGLGPSFRPKNVGHYMNRPIYVMNIQQDVIFQGIPVDKVKASMDELLAWVNQASNAHAIVKSAIASLWLVTIHPFEDGNGRLSRALSDLIISSEWKDLRTFSISSAILRRKNEYYDELYKLQHGSSMDITSYIAWYIDLVTKAMETAALSCKSKIRLYQFMLSLDPSEYSFREITMLYKLASGFFFGKLTADKYTKMMKCTSATSSRDLSHLCSRDLLVKSAERGRATWYFLNPELGIASVDN